MKTADMPNPALDGIIEAILKPLRFASRDGFARLQAVKGLERHVTRLCGNAIETGGDTAQFNNLKTLFSGFDGFDAGRKRAAIETALAIIGSDAQGLSLNIPALSPSAVNEPLLPPSGAAKMLEKLKTPLGYCKGIGPKLAGRLAKKGLKTCEDVLYFLPIRYEDRTRIKKIKELVPGEAQSTSGTVMALGEVYYGRRKVFEMAVSDGAGILRLKWFHYKLAYMKRYKTGQRLLLFGPVSAFGRQLEMVHPDAELMGEGEELSAQNGIKGVLPVYSQVENFHQKTVRKIVRGIVEAYADCALSGVPADGRRRRGIVAISEAFKQVHCAAPQDGPAPFNPALMRRSIAFDELFLLEIALALKRAGIKKEKGFSFHTPQSGRSLEKKLRELLPFKLTHAQERTLSEIKTDMESSHHMNRLIQGDVGSGKTVVSFIAALRAVEAGHQAAIMSPTEILSEQHYLGIHRYGEGLGIRCAILTGGLTKKERARALAGIKNGSVDIVIGTHALFQKEVEFRSLGIAIIDEQHRFGVEQRALFKKKGGSSCEGVMPDVLIMTATPIPRTLSMTVFGDLDVSVIDELPPGRHPVKTRILREKDRASAYEMIRGELTAGNQAYIVYPLVEESEELSLKDAVSMKERLQRDVFPEFIVGLLHGRMKADEKEAVMKAFKAGNIHCLAATTVIEVGVDVPDATVILIEHAERFGLSQLHQLRGRVGRSDKKAMCLLLAAWTNSEDTYTRLRVMETTQDGFKIAEEDLKIRGPGDFLGIRQSGLPDFRNAGALGDIALVKAAREEALMFVESNPELFGPKPSCIKEILKARWSGRLELAGIG